MPVLISLLRGVNVGGNNILPMARFQTLLGELGFTGAETLLQSGNAVFRAPKAAVAGAGPKIADGIARTFGFRCSVVIRTAAELRDAAARNPFAARDGIDPARLLVSFLASAPSEEVREKVLAVEAPPEELFLDGREMYIWFPDGVARPKLPLARIERMLGTPATGRNWNTVMKLLALAEKQEAKGGKA